MDSHTASSEWQQSILIKLIRLLMGFTCLKLCEEQQKNMITICVNRRRRACFSSKENEKNLKFHLPYTIPSSTLDQGQFYSSIWRRCRLNVQSKQKHRLIMVSLDSKQTIKTIENLQKAILRQQHLEIDRSHSKDSILPTDQVSKLSLSNECILKWLSNLSPSDQ